jgi:hypothetical protein
MMKLLLYCSLTGSGGGDLGPLEQPKIPMGRELYQQIDSDKEVRGICVENRRQGKRRGDASSWLSSDRSILKVD